MRFAAVLLSLMLLLVESHAAPTWEAKSSAPQDLSPSHTNLRFERPPIAEELAEKEYKDQRLAEFVESTLGTLFDKYNIVPEEHDWGGPDRPFNLDEYYKILTPSDKPKRSRWRKIWQWIYDLFSVGAAAAPENIGTEPKTILATDRASMEDTESPFDFTENDTASSYTTKEDIDTINGYIVQEEYDLKWKSGFRKRSEEGED